MNQSLVDFEEAFADQIRAERQRARAVQAKIEHRTVQRQVKAVNRRGTLRFGLLVTTLVLTAIFVTLVMFRALYWVLG